MKHAHIIAAVPGPPERTPIMKRLSTLVAASVMLVGGLGMASASTKSSAESSRKPVEATGCLERASVAKTYTVKTSDGTTWGVTEDRALLLNNYVGRTVSVSGDPIHPKASERAAVNAAHYMHAMDVAVDNDKCQQ
jgi:hypothetical protein